MLTDDAASAAEPYAELLDVDADAAAMGADSALLDPGSDGLLTAPREKLLCELARRREGGASLRSLRRDAGEIDPFTVSDAAFERALERGRRLNQWQSSGRHGDLKRYYAGVSVRACPVCGRHILVRALRRTGCAVCAPEEGGSDAL